MSHSVPTLRDVAKMAGVSIATVSYVLNGRRLENKTISETTRQKVLEAVAELGYMPNQAARHLRRQSTERICIVLPRLGIPYFEALCREIECVAEQYKYTVLLALADTYEKERKMLTQLRYRLADGAIIVHGRSTSEELDQLAQAGIAVVAFSNHVSSQTFDVVQTTEEEVFYQAVRYLLEKGYRRVAYLYSVKAIKERQPTQDPRLTAYKQALQDFGITPDESLILNKGAGDRQEAYWSAINLFQRAERPDAIFAGSDFAAISAIWAARDLGLHVPDDVAIIGAGNIPEGEITSPPLTTIGPASLDFKAVGELIFSRLQNPDCQGRVHLYPWKLIVRGSA